MTRLHPVIDEAMRSDGLKFDQWGTALAVLGALCDVVSAAGLEAEIPSDVGYRSAPGAPWNMYRQADRDSRMESFFEEAAEFDEYDLQRDIVAAIDRFRDPARFIPSMRAMTFADIAYAIRVLHRYASVLKLAGEDY